jgi:Flp pilus assembly protein TadG
VRVRQQRAGPRSPPTVGPSQVDSGTAIVEFVLLGVVLLVPLMYLVLAVSAVQRNLYGVTHAAREAGRAYATGTMENAAERAAYAARLAMEDQGLPSDGITVRYGPADRDCHAAGAEPWPLMAGSEFAVCVTQTITVPAVPGVLLGHRNTVSGRYVVHADDYRDYHRAVSAVPPSG